MNSNNFYEKFQNIVIFKLKVVSIDYVTLSRFTEQLDFYKTLRLEHACL